VAKRLILCTILGLALLLPETGFAVPTKRVNKKSSSSLKVKKSSRTAKASKSTRSKHTRKVRASSKRRKKRTYSSSRHHRTRSYRDETPRQPYTAGLGKPLMKVIPQRDGRFLLEPLTPKKKTIRRLSGPTSKLEEKKEVVPGRGYNLYEPWNFRELVLAKAKGYQGTPYSMGSSLKYGNATDCSGFVQYIYQGFKINLPRCSREQAQVGKVVTHDMDFSKLVPGDLLFFSRGGHSVGHAGIYLGEGKMIHASSRGRGVTITDLRENYYQRNFVVAKRVFEVSYLK
jgi:cell wall-associated NlpC family hydrolase